MWIDARGGIASSASLYAAGFSRHHVARATAEGHIRRIRRSWLATPACHEDLVAATAAGGRLTCVSAAKRMGLWTPIHQGLHIAVHSNGARFALEGAHFHWAQPPVPLPRTEPTEHILNVLFHVARCLDTAAALAVWESALRKQLVDAPLLTRVTWRSARASELVAAASSASDAGTETQFRILMTNIGVPVRQQVRLDGHPVDGLIGERLVIQIDGFAHHSTPADRRRDIRADARLALRGFTVLRFDYQQVFFDPAHVTSTVQIAIAQRLHRR